MTAAAHPLPQTTGFECRGIGVAAVVLGTLAAVLPARRAGGSVC